MAKSKTSRGCGYYSDESSRIDSKNGPTATADGDFSGFVGSSRDGNPAKDSVAEQVAEYKRGFGGNAPSSPKGSK